MSEFQFDLTQLARLAGLELRPEDEERLRGQLVRVLEYVAAVEGIPGTEESDWSLLAEGAAWRADEARPPLEVEAAMKLAVQHVEDCFRVPPVMKDAQG